MVSSMRGELNVNTLKLPQRLDAFLHDLYILQHELVAVLEHGQELRDILAVRGHRRVLLRNGDGHRLRVLGERHG